MSNTDQAQQNREYVRRLLKKKRPEFAAVLERVLRELRDTCDQPSAESPAPGLIPKSMLPEAAMVIALPGTAAAIG